MPNATIGEILNKLEESGRQQDLEETITLEEFIKHLTEYWDDKVWVPNSYKPWPMNLWFQINKYSNIYSFFMYGNFQS